MSCTIRLQFAYDYSAAITQVKRIASAVLLGSGLLLVFLGLSSALGFTTSGMRASSGVIVALLYAGATWFAPASRKPAAPAETEATVGPYRPGV